MLYVQFTSMFPHSNLGQRNLVPCVNLVPRAFCHMSPSQGCGNEVGLVCGLDSFDVIDLLATRADFVTQ